MRYKIAAGVAIITALAFGYYKYSGWISSPNYTLHALKRAIDEHDMETFEEYVDIEGVTRSIIDQIQELDSNGKSSSPFDRGLQELISSFAGDVIADAGREAARGYIEKGETPDLSALGDPKLTVQMSQIGLSELTFQGWPTLDTDGKISRLTQTVAVPKYKDEIRVTFLMRMQRGHWRVAEVLNLAEAIKELDLIQRRWPYKNWPGAIEKLARDLSNTKAYAASLAIAALVHHRVDADIQAQRIALEAQEWMERNPEQEPYWYNKNSLFIAQYYHAAGDKSRAKTIQESALQKTRSANDKKVKDLCMAHHAFYAFSIGDCENARYYLKEIGDEVHRCSAQAGVITDFPDAYVTCELSLESVIEQAQRISDPAMRVALAAILVKAASKLGKNDMAANLAAEAKYDIDEIEANDIRAIYCGFLASSLTASDLPGASELWEISTALQTQISDNQVRDNVKIANSYARALSGEWKLAVELAVQLEDERYQALLHIIECACNAEMIPSTVEIESIMTAYQGPRP